MPPFRIASLGVDRKFQTAGIFESLTVAERLRIACALHDEPSFLRSLERLALPAAARSLSMPPALRSRCRAKHASCRMARSKRSSSPWCWRSSPDHLARRADWGLTKAERARIGRVLVDLVAQCRLAVALVEHDLYFVREISSRVVVLHQGKIVLTAR